MFRDAPYSSHVSEVVRHLAKLARIMTRPCTWSSMTTEASVAPIAELSLFGVQHNDASARETIEAELFLP
jgi:hypothetical protein